MNALDEKKAAVKALVSQAVKELYGVECDFEIIRPGRGYDANLAATAALVLGGTLRRPPVEIAREIAGTLVLPPGERVEAAGKGFLNFFLKPGFLLAGLNRHPSPTPPAMPELSDPDFPSIYPVVRLCALLRAQGHPPDGSERLELLETPEEERLLWAIFGGGANELKAAALDFYDRVGLGGGLRPLETARYILLGNALEVMIKEMERINHEK